MKQIFLSVVEDVVLYNNHRFLLVLFLLALVTLWVIEKDRSIRSIFLYTVVGLICVFFCPLYAKIAFKVDEEIYYRVWWTIPMGTLICYTFTKIMFSMKKKWSRAILFALAIMVIIINGKFVYTNSIHFKSKNTQHLPEMVVHIGDALTEEYDSPRAVLPLELLPFIRQYHSGITVPFSRFYFGADVTVSDPLFQAYQSDIYDIKVITDSAKTMASLYVVLSSLKEKDEAMESYDYELIGLVDGYEIYRDKTVYRDLVECGIIQGKKVE